MAEPRMADPHDVVRGTGASAAVHLDLAHAVDLRQVADVEQGGHRIPAECTYRTLLARASVPHALSSSAWRPSASHSFTVSAD